MNEFTNGYALVVGIGADLPNTVADATGLVDILTDPTRSGYPVSQVQLLTEQVATREGILRSLDWLAQSVNGDATVVVYFSGHGYQLKSKVESTSYLLPYGYDIQRFEQTGISTEDFNKKLRAIPTDKLLVLLDCCHSAGLVDTMISDNRPRSAMSLATEDVRSLSGRGRVIIASSQADEVAWTGQPYSVFTLALMEALSGVGVSRKDGFVRVSDIALHVREVVPPRTGGRQHPVLYFEQADDFVAGYYAGGEVEPRGLPVSARPEFQPESGSSQHEQPPPVPPAGGAQTEEPDQSRPVAVSGDLGGFSDRAPMSENHATETVPALMERLRDKDAAVRRAAVEALGEIGDPTIVSTLLESLRDKDAAVRLAAVDALRRIGAAERGLSDRAPMSEDHATETVPVLVEMLRDRDAAVRLAAAEALGEIGDSSAVLPLLAALQDESASVRLAVISALGRSDDPQVASALIERVQHDEDAEVRRAAAETLGRLGRARDLVALVPQGMVDQQEALAAVQATEDEDIRQDLMVVLREIESTPQAQPEEPEPPQDSGTVDQLVGLRDQNVEVRRNTARRLVASVYGSDGEPSPDAVEQLEIALRDPDKGVRLVVVEALGESGVLQAAGYLLEALQDLSSYEVRQTAAEALGNFSDLDNVGPLVLALSDRSMRVRRAAADSLVRLWRTSGFRPLVTDGSVDAERTMAAIQRLGDESKRVELLAALALVPLKPLEEPAARSMWEAARAIEDQSARAAVLSGLVPHLTDSLQERVLEEALAGAHAIGEHEPRAQVLMTLVPYLQSESKGQIVQDIETAIDDIGDEQLQEHLREELKNRLSVVPDTDRVPVVSDRARGKDRLGFTSYVVAFEQLIKDADPPITIGVYGAWGTGKTFLMNMIARRLGHDPEEELVVSSQVLNPLTAIIVRFWRWFIDEPGPVEDKQEAEGDVEENKEVVQPSEIDAVVVVFQAWDYNGCEKLWAGLVERIFLSFEDSELGWLDKARINVPRNLEHQWRNLRVRILPYTLIAIVVCALAISLLLVNQKALAAVVGSTAGLALFIKQLWDVLSTPASKRIAELFTVPHYQEELGFMGRIRQDLESFAKSLPEDMRVVVFIDDLDRCDPKKAVEVLEAVKLLLDFDRFIVFIGLDARIITQAIEEHYGKVLIEAQITGYEYLDKIVQIPFSIPEPSPSELCGYLGWLVRMRKDQISSIMKVVDASRSDTGPSDLPPSSEPSVEQAESARPPELSLGPQSPTPLPDLSSPQKPPSKPDTVKLPFIPAEQLAFLDLHAHLDPNPRRVKRLVNVYRLVRVLIDNEPEEADLLEKPGDIIAWLVLCEQWPYAAHMMLETLDRETDLGEEATVEQLYERAQGCFDQNEALRKLDLDYDHLESFVKERLFGMRLGDVRRLRRFTVNFNPALSAEVRLTLRSEGSPQGKSEEPSAAASKVE